MNWSRCLPACSGAALLMPGRTAASKRAMTGTKRSMTLWIVVISLCCWSARITSLLRFIQEEEQPKLLQRRQEISGRVIPIIVRPCMWQSEPVLKDIQALPKDGKPVITFSKENGDRDQVWTEIATAVEKRAKEKTTP